MSFVEALKLAESVMEQYRLDQPKWWKRMDGTPILNDVSVRMAEAFLKETERLRAEVERLTAERDSPRNRCPQCDQLRLELGEARAKIANLVRWQEEAVRNCAQRRCGRRDARIVELEADLLAQINTNIEVGGLLDAAIARVEAAEKNAGRMREFLLAFINGGVNQDFRLWASEVLSDMEDGT